MCMAPSHLLPFKVGQQAESKCFVKGYRGAWFRCKINKLIQNKDSIKGLLEYYDYPGEKMHLTQLYQKPSKNSIRSMDERKAQLILRPCFPPLYQENQMPDLSTIPDLIVIVDDVWKVGDLVDWWYDGCYWSARVTHLLGKDKVQVDLPNPPIGEGKSYEALCNDLRPSLDWSLEHGWTVPESETSRCCARLVRPQIKGKGGNENCSLASNTTGFASCKIHSSVSSARLAASLLPLRDNEQENYELVEYGVCASCDTGTSVSSSTLVSSLLPPAGNTDPRVNETSRHCSSGEDTEKEMEVQSTKVSLDLVDGTKEIASGSDKASSTLAASSLPLEVNEISRPDSGREESEPEIEVQSTAMNLDSDDCGRETTSSFETSTQKSGKEENENTEVLSTDINLDSDADRRGMISKFNKASGTSCGSFLPPVGCISPEMNEASTQSSGMEVTEQSAEIQRTSMNLDSDAAGKEATGRFDKSSLTPGALFLYSACNSPETNDTSMRSLGTGKTEKGVQSMNMILNSEDGKKQVTNVLDKVSGSHEVVSPSNVTKFSCGKDQYNFRQLPKRLRITENHHPARVAEANAIESSVLELEELANKIKWLKGLIIFGLRWSNAMKPSWKFSET